MRASRSIIILFLSSCLIAIHSFAQSVSFKQIPAPEGSTFGVVTGITQDPEGFMWFATSRGLHRYDGYRMVSYRNDPLNPRSLATNHIECVYADEKGLIWVGTFGAGLYRLDPSNGDWINYRHNPQSSTSLSNDTVTVVMKDHEGTLWVGTNHGLSRFDGNHRFQNYYNSSQDLGSLSSNQVRAIYEDRQGTLWIGTGSPFPSDGGTSEEGGLNKLDRRTGTFTRYMHNPKDPNSLLNNKVRALLEDSRGNFWVGTSSDGLHLMDRNRGTFQRFAYDPSHPERLSVPVLKNGKAQNGGVTFIHEDAAGVLWIGSFYGGVNRYDPKTGKVDHYDANSAGVDNYSANGAWWAYTSRDGVLWIGSNEGNLYRVNPFRKIIPHYDLADAPVNCFFEDKAGILWIGTEKGLVRNDRKTGNLQWFVNDPRNSGSISSDHIQSIMEDRQGRLWISTSDAGLNLFDRKRLQFIRYQNNSKNKNSISSNNVLPVYEDRQGVLWVATTRGLDRMDPATGTFIQYLFNPKDTNYIGQNTVTSVVEDRQGYLWAGTWLAGGLNRLDRKSGKIKNYLNGLNITSVLEDRQGVLWAGSDEGLFRYNPQTDTYERFIDPSSGIGINNTSSIIEDKEHHLWLATYNGIIRINANRNETSIYDRNYGVIGNNLVMFAAYQCREGELFFGDRTGYYSFHPNQLTKNVKPPQITFTAFRLGGELVRPGKDGPLKEPLSMANQIRLKYKQNTFSFDFAGIDYTNPENNRHVYMLEGYDDTWHNAGSDRRSYYFNVPPGRYTFRLKAANSDGVWAEKALSVIITPPWWQTWWAYTLLALLFTGAIWVIIHYRSYRLLHEKHILEKKVAARTAEVVKQKEEIAMQRDNLERTLQELKTTQSQLIQKEKMASLGELTAGIAHEIQNPLNFVNNFSDISIELLHELREGALQQLPDETKREATEITNSLEDNLQKVMYHGKRADSIVKNMLQHSRANSGQKQPTDINALTDEYLRLAYHGMRAKDKSFNAVLETHFEKDLQQISVVPQDIGRVLLNLFNNAFQSITEKKKLLNGVYQPTVLVQTKRKGDAVTISVYDNGMGIPHKELDKIYQPFFTTKPPGQGTGLGLSLSYDIVTKGHGGEIKVETEEGEYAEFVVQLPVTFDSVQ
ncbi:MAG: SMP-30/gluconolactonase/LRE family protein [Flavisolibacter sp.]|nr:SMP-30/gluconolactonase/LRE family protein [Flavisolibacter sp.]